MIQKRRPDFSGAAADRHRDRADRRRGRSPLSGRASRSVDDRLGRRRDRPPIARIVAPRRVPAPGAMCRCIRPSTAYCILSPRPIPRVKVRNRPDCQVERGNPANRQRIGIRCTNYCDPQGSKAALVARPVEENRQAANNHRSAAPVQGQQKPGHRFTSRDPPTAFVSTLLPKRLSTPESRHRRHGAGGDQQKLSSDQSPPRGWGILLRHIRGILNWH
jgi:hypothetical protein